MDGMIGSWDGEWFEWVGGWVDGWVGGCIIGVWMDACLRLELEIEACLVHMTHPGHGSQEFDC